MPVRVIKSSPVVHNLELVRCLKEQGGCSVDQSASLLITLLPIRGLLGSARETGSHLKFFNLHNRLLIEGKTQTPSAILSCEIFLCSL